MIKHMVFFKFLDEANGRSKAENLVQAKEMLDNLVGRVPTLRAMTCGPVAVPGGWDFALIAEFDDVVGLEAYTDHPEHRKVSAFMGQVRSDRAAADLSC